MTCFYQQLGIESSINPDPNRFCPYSADSTVIQLNCWLCARSEKNTIRRRPPLNEKRLPQFSQSIVLFPPVYDARVGYSPFYVPLSPRLIPMEECRLTPTLVSSTSSAWIWRWHGWRCSVGGTWGTYAFVCTRSTYSVGAQSGLIPNQISAILSEIRNKMISLYPYNAFSSHAEKCGGYIVIF